MPRLQLHIQAYYDDCDADLTTVRNVSFPGRASQSMEEVDTAGCRLDELSDMLAEGKLPVVPDTQENQEGIAEHSLSINCERLVARTLLHNPG